MTPENDEVHLTAIRKALLAGNAAVMIGAGFSRNAEGGETLKDWQGLATALWSELNPDRPMDGYSPALVSQLGEQYAQIFSPPALENLLKRLIPDDKVTPGLLHEQLLELPWSELFTTNYDTLLERTAERIVDRAHYVVTCREDIPQSKVLGRRRIVKLHGSFPSQRPFIFTEEHFRRYPDAFAPFVNLVRQSLLENVFCLIGFSGDDPNFLHWIGWVRDMLDQHALPIYLLLGTDPSRGQRKLLESRGVTPVVLPTPAGSASSDYPQRYAALFRLLAKRLAPADREWGASIDISSEYRAFTTDHSEQLEGLLGAFPALRRMRDTYPGWLIAPAPVRHQYATALGMMPSYLNDHGFYARLEADSPLLAIVFLSQYAWQQEVILQGIDDRIAEIAIRLLRSRAADPDLHHFDTERLTLARVGVHSPDMFQPRWRGAALGLLRWARQELRRDIWAEIKDLLETSMPDDIALKDAMAHEAILLAIHQGDRDQARGLLAKWNPRSSDEYMRVRKGALLAEVSDAEVALPVCVSALQGLRRRQRGSPEGARYLSEEAWACMIIRNLQHAKRGLTFASESEATDPTLPPEKIERRLSDLAGKGYDVIRETTELASRLNAEAQPPSPTRNLIPSFGVGRYSHIRHFGVPAEFQRKVLAAFEWLTLTDRVGLVPRIGNVTFDLDSYLQAAWWAQYANSMPRVLSVLIRSLSTKALQPKDPDKLPHHTGWLSRYQVARLDQSLAWQTCSRAMAVIDRAAAGATNDDTARVLGFQLELFSHLVVRIIDTQQVQSFAESLVALHHNPVIQRAPDVWRPLVTALARCLEASPSHCPVAVAIKIVAIPTAPSDGLRNSARRFEWLRLESFEGLPAPSANPVADPALDLEVQRLLRDIAQLPEGRDVIQNFELGRAWSRLFWLDRIGALPPATRALVGEVLWRGGSKRWPLIPDHYPHASALWPAPEGIDGPAVFRHFILSMQLQGFEHPSTMTVARGSSKRQWGLPADDTFLMAWAHSLTVAAWPLEDTALGLEIIQRWWNAEWHDLAQASPWDDLHDAVVARLDLIDIVLGNALPDDWRVNTSLTGLLPWIDAVISSGRSYGAPFWRFRLRNASIAADNEERQRVEKDIAEQFLSANPLNLSVRAAGVVIDWIDSKIAPGHCPNLLVNALCAIVATRRMPGLAWALHLLTKIVRRRAGWFEPRNLTDIELGLSQLLTELSYQDRPFWTGISDDEVPLLRLNCARLALALIGAENPQNVPAASKWLAACESDPLPEMRFLKERYAREP